MKYIVFSIFCITQIFVSEIHGQQSDSSAVIQRHRTLVFKKYGTDRKKRIRSGVLLKVYQYPTESAETKFAGWKNLFSKNNVSRGRFQYLEGDSLVLKQSSREIKYHIDDLLMIKAYNNSGARVLGSLVSVVGYYGLVIGGTLVGTGLSSVSQNDGFGGFFLATGLIFGGLGYLIDQGGLVIRRSKFQLVNRWYVEGAAGYL